MPFKQSVVELAAIASEIKLRASVSAQQIAASTQAELLHAVAEYIKIRAGVDAQVLDAATQVVLLKADAIVGQFLTFVGLYESLRSTDTQAHTISKVLAELLAARDIVARSVNKPFADSMAVGDASFRRVNKSPAEALSSSDASFRQFNRAVTQEALAAHDITSLNPIKNFAEATYTLEGPSSGQNYVDVTYLAQDYVLDGGPHRIFAKALADLVNATDDFFGQANVDDDEVMWFTKTLADNSSTSETLGKQFIRPGVTDSAAASDFAQRAASKSFAEVLSRSDIVVRSSSKALADTAGTADTQTRSTDKVLSDFPVMGDLKTFSLAKIATDSAATSDALTRSSAKSLADSAINTDAMSRQAGKTLADSKATSDSGNLRKTDYCDITYFAQDYVGSTINF